MIEIDVVGARRSGFESNGFADHKGDGILATRALLGYPELSSIPMNCDGLNEAVDTA
jgi:hypothetical protein